VTATDPSGNSTTNTYEVTSSGPSKTFTYDANGNLTSDGTRTFEWDARNQLVAVTVGTHRSEFTYDGLQRRVRIVEKENGVTQSDAKVVWCEKQICEERAADGVTNTRRPFALGEQVGTATRLFAIDHLGSITDVTDTWSGLLARYAFDPWGRRTLAAGADITSMGFTGHQWHSSAGLWFTLFRAYDAEFGRWASEDPLRLVDGPFFYAYVGNNPMRWVDAEGLFKTTSQTTTSNSVTCDGSGNTTLKIVTNNSCIRDCVVAHERSHQRDINSRNPGICKGVKAGTHIAPDDDAERRWTERRGCRAELDCLKRKLQSASCDCKSDIENRIKQMNTWCAQWGK
jgi:RHS repeat-associated protein